MVCIPVRVTSDLSPILAYEMAKSVRRHMPSAILIHIAEVGATKLNGFDELMNVDPHGDFVDQLLRVLQELDGDVLSLDYDVLLQDDVSHVFSADFDIAVTSRPIGDKTIRHDLRTSYNMGVVFSKNKAFWTEVRKLYSTLKERDGWLHSQSLASQCIRLLNGRFKVLEVPGEIYNYTPMTEQEDVSMRKIVHYKGARKPWMLPPELRSSVAGNVAKTLGLVAGRGA